MKRLIALLLTVGMILALCGCGGNTAEEPTVNDAKAEVVIETTAPEITEPTEDPSAYADDMFAVEDIVYEMRRDELQNFEIKIRNLTEEKHPDIYFGVQALDTRGDVLAAWTMGTQDSLQPGQACWFYCSNNLFDDCDSIEEAMMRADAIRVTRVHIQTIKDDPKSWVDYEFANLPTFRLADIQPKG